MTFFVRCFKCGADMTVHKEPIKMGEPIFTCKECGHVIPKTIEW